MIMLFMTFHKCMLFVWNLDMCMILMITYLGSGFSKPHFLSLSKPPLILTLNLIQWHTYNIKKKKEKKEMHLIIVIFLLKEREKKRNAPDLCRLSILLHWKMKVTAVTINNGGKFMGLDQLWSLLRSIDKKWN